MARGDTTWRRDVAKLTKDLRAVLSPKVIRTHMAKHKGEHIINAMIGLATGGTGPNMQNYPAYSKKYAKLKQAAGHMRWLRGMKNTGRSGGMLDPKRFALTVIGNKLWMVWTSAGGAMDTYADLHNKRGPKMPKRPWFHFESNATVAAIDEALKQTVDELAAKFNAGRPIR